MKKLLALVLALVMTLSLATVSTNAFTDDAKINENYAEAVQVLNGMGVFKGYEDKSFRPEGEITRAEVAAIVYRIYTGDVTDAQAKLYAGYGKFDDVNTNAWYAGYVGYCTNAGFIKGYGDGNFGPNDKVTGYQALAMILRAVGYDKNGEFEGKDWELHVAQIAQQIGALVNTQGEVLKNPASRQLVAELLFRCLQAPQVTYTPAFGYTPINGIGDKRSLGEKVFNLKEVGEVNGDYGRPGYVWTYKTGNKKTFIAYKPVFTSNVAVDECDICKAVGITKSALVSEAWLDGVNVTATTHLTGSNYTLDPSHPGLGSNLVGDQGRLTEVYALNDGTYSIVEINTYFGEVTKVVADKTDKNGHVTAGYSNLIVYLQDDKGVAVTGYADNSFAAGDYVLVTLDRADNDIANLGARQTLKAGDIFTAEVVKPTMTAPVAAYSTRACNDLTTIKDSQGFVVGTITLDKTKYNDADKFYVGYPNKADVASAYDVFLDTYGNVIALTIPAAAAKTYAVINAIRWNSPALGTTVGGYVTANLTLADGSVVNDVVVYAINGKAPRTADFGEGKVATSSVSNAYYLNGEYYGHIVNYSVNANGMYALNNVVDHEKTPVQDADGKVVITKGKSTIMVASQDKVNVVYASDETVFLVDNGKYGYDVYVGYNKVPTMTADTMCYMLNSNGYVALAVIDGTAHSSTQYQAYLARTTRYSYEVVNNTVYDVFYVYKIGTTEPTKILMPYNTTLTSTGFYDVEIIDGVATLTLVQKGPDTNPGCKDIEYAGHLLDVTRARTAVVANSVQTTVNGQPNKNFSNMINAKYFLVDNGVVTEAAYTDIAAMDIIAVLYDKTIYKVGDVSTEIFTPVYVYLTAADDAAGDQDTDVNKPDPAKTANITINYSACTVANSSNVVVANGTQFTAALPYTFVVIGGATAPQVSVDNNGVLVLVGSNTVNGTYTYQLNGVAGADYTITIQ